MTAPEVACIVPTHHRDALLDVALASIDAQSLPPAAVLVVDDTGSTSTAALASRWGRRYVDGSALPSKGASASRNAGAAASTSEYLAFLDDDDRWEPDFLRSCVEELEASGADLVAAWGSLEVRGRVVTSSWRLTEGAVAAQTVAHNPGLTGSNFVIRRSVFDALGGFDDNLPVYNDLDFFVRFLRAGYRYTVVEQPLVIQSADGGDHLSSRGERRAAGIKAYLEKHRTHVTPAQVRRLNRDYHLALRYRGQNPAISALHFALMWANSTPSQVTRVLREKATRGTSQYS